MRPGSLAVWCVSVCLVGAPALAAETTPGVLYAGVAASPEAAGRVASALALLEPPVSLASPPVHVDEVIPPGGATVLGASEVARCAGQPVDAAGYRGQLDRLRTAMNELDDILPQAQEIRRAQACLSEPVAAGELAMAAYLEGLYLFGEGQPDSARSAYAEALSLDPEYEWDTDYPPAMQEPFNDAGLALIRSAQARLQVAVPTGAEVWIDGTLAEAPLQGVTLPPGRHVIQLRTAPAQPITSLVVVLDPGAGALVVDPAAIAPGAGADGTPVLHAIVSQLWATAAETAPTMLVALAPEPAAWRWDEATAGLTAVPMPAAAVAAARGEKIERRPGPGGGPHPATVALIASGAGLLAAGGILSGVNAATARGIEQDVADGEIDFPAEDDPGRDDDPNYQDWHAATQGAYAGYALLAVGGVALAASIPVGIATAQGGRTVALTARLHAAPPALDAPGAMPRLDGFSLTLDIR